MIGVPGIAKRLFGAINDAGCSVVIITQGGSEHSICFALPMEQSKKAVAAVEYEFREELVTKEVCVLWKMLILHDLT